MQLVRRGTALQGWRIHGRGYNKTGLTHHPRQKSPLQYLLMMVTHPLFKTKTPNTEGPKAGWVRVKDVFWLPRHDVELAECFKIIWIDCQHLKNSVYIKTTIRFLLGKKTVNPTIWNSHSYDNSLVPNGYCSTRQGIHSSLYSRKPHPLSSTG